MKYFTVEEAAIMLTERQADKSLFQRVEERWGNRQYPLVPGRKGVIYRHLATARWEDLWFAQQCKSVGLAPTWLTFRGDSFCSQCPEKMALVHPIVHSGYGRSGGAKIIKRKLAFPQRWENRPLDTIVAEGGKKVIELHEKCRERVGLGGEVMDMSNWLLGFGRANQYYPCLFMAAVTHVVMFEDFHDPARRCYREFLEGVVEPAWKGVVDEMGLPEPLIVKIPSQEKDVRVNGIVLQEGQHLDWYPAAAFKEEGFC